MKRVLIVAVVSVAMTLGVAYVASANGSDDVTLKLYGMNKEAVYLDHGTPGLSQGDQKLISWELYNAKGDRVGRYATVVTVVDIGDDHGESIWASSHDTIRLPGGEIIGGGMVAYHAQVPSQVNRSPSDVQAIVGGSGAYQGVWGEYTYGAAGAGRQVFVFHLHRR
jgi:hypothetical protein